MKDKEHSVRYTVPCRTWEKGKGTHVTCSMYICYMERRGQYTVIKFVEVKPIQIRCGGDD
jgi:hypothetical protein